MLASSIPQDRVVIKGRNFEKRWTIKCDSKSDDNLHPVDANCKLLEEMKIILLDKQVIVRVAQINLQNSKLASAKHERM